MLSVLRDRQVQDLRHDLIEYSFEKREEILDALRVKIEQQLEGASA